MITIQDWVKFCEGDDVSLFYPCAGQVLKETNIRIPIVWDSTLKTFVLCNNYRATFADIFKSDKECAEFIVNNIRKEYGIK